MDLIIRRAKLTDSEQLTDIGIRDGKIIALESYIANRGKQEIDAQGRLVTPAFVDPHIHLDKVMIVDVVRENVSGTLTEAIEITWEKKASYTIDDIVQRAGQVISLAAQNGTTRMRSHVDVDSIGKLMPLKGVQEARKLYSDIMDIQIVAFPQEGIIKDPGTEKLMWEAMEEGADLVGGMPANENSSEASKKHVDIVFEIAKAFNADIDMHVDETDNPESRTLEMIADKAMEMGWEGRVTAGHTCALAAYDDAYAEYVMDKVKAAGIHMITNPVTNLMLQGRLDKQPKRRGITRVKELLERGINVSFGQDCVKDTFYPFGHGDLLEVAFVTAHAAHMSMPKEIEQVFEMMTNNAAKILKADNYGLKHNARADLVVLDCHSIKDAIRLRPDRSYVIKEGRVIAVTETKRYLNRLARG
ncbi:MAG: amidohydrolase family protein [Bacillota bacterium]|jgi:cytosine deaminase